MASLIPGFEYDIFISYRQKDNKYDGWVSEFVDNLRKELSAAYKEEASVYFDISSHDGLSEIHDVDASLKNKLKCLIFVPILSRTYCDTKSFAWRNEFLAFVGQASQDRFGLKVSLPGGRIANRVIPIQIHDLVPDDFKLVKEHIGSFKPVDFVYYTRGVNRPLRQRDDDLSHGINPVVYRDQINKTALEIMEVISGMRGEKSVSLKQGYKDGELKDEIRECRKKASLKKNKLLTGSGILAILIIAGIFIYPIIIKSYKLDKLKSKNGKIAIAVMPFLNITSDTTMDRWQEGIQYILINSLSCCEDLRVRRLETTQDLLLIEGVSDYASLTPPVAGSVSKKLGTNVSIQGSIIQSGSTILLNTRLVNTKTGEVLKSVQVEGISDSIVHVIETLSSRIQRYLNIPVVKHNKPVDSGRHIKSDFPEALTYLMKGFRSSDALATREWLEKAVAADSTFFDAIVQLWNLDMSQGMYEPCKQLCLMVYKKRDIWCQADRLWIDYQYASLFQTPDEQIKCLMKLQEDDEQYPDYCRLLGNAYYRNGQYDKAVAEYEKVLEIYNNWPSFYSFLGDAYIQTKQFGKAEKLYQTTELTFPNYPAQYFERAILAFSMGDTVNSNKYIEKFISSSKDNSWTESRIALNVGLIYSEAGILDKAEDFYRKAYLLEPGNPTRVNYYAYFLIDKDKNINEGLRLINKALASSPENYDYLQTKGLGLYKQGKFREALEVLQRSWDLRMEKAIYDHEAYLHLEAAKKAVEKQKL